MKTRYLVLSVAAATLAVPGFVRAAEPAGPQGPAINRVLSLDGKSGYVQVGDAKSLHSFTGAITIEVLLKASSFCPNQGNVNSLVRKNVSASEESFFLRFRTVGGKPAVEMTPGSHIGVLRVPYDFATDKWYHLAGTYDGRVMAVFVNGARIGSQRCSGQMYIDRSDLLIGKGDPEFSFGEYFHGAVDEIRLWNVARSEKEIRAAMNTTLTGKEKGLVAYWNFDAGTAADLSPHGNDGRPHEGARIVESPRPKLKPERQSAEPVVGAEALTTEQRLEVLETLWTNLSEIYPALEYKGVYGREWIEPAEKRIRRATSDQEFYQILLELMASLNDTHTRILSYPGQPRLASPPVVLNQVEGRVAVIRAEADTGLSPGDVIVSVDGRPAQQCLVEKMKRVCNSTQRGRIREACGQLLRGTPGTPVAVTAQGADGKHRGATLRRLSSRGFWYEPTISSRPLSDSVGYIRIARWAGGKGLVDEFDRILETFKSTRGIVIDVRGNGGGSGELADLVNGRLTDKPVISSLDLWREAGSDQYRKAIGWARPRGPWTYQGRIAVLMDEASMSSCEHFVSGAEAMGNVLLVGAPTNGAGGGPTNVQLSDGTKVAISRALGLRANGIVFEGHGIPPHVLSTPTLEDLRQGRDAALVAAKEWILSDRGIPARTQPLPLPVGKSVAK